MRTDTNAAVEEFRRRIKAQAEITRKLEELVASLEASPAAEGAEQAATRSPDRARADLERSEAKLKALKRNYALFRLRHALGPDPEHVEEAVLDDALVVLTSSRLTRHEQRQPGDGPIAFAAFRELMLADLPLGQLVENEAADRKSGVLFDSLEEQTSTKNILRRWTSQLATDPYVANILRYAADAAARFRDCLEKFLRGLEGLRLAYELKRQRADNLAIAFVGQRPFLQALNSWENIEHFCPNEARRLLENFHGLDTAREELKRLRDELNDELRAFVRTFFPRYVTYVTRQSKPRRQALGLGKASPRRLCRYVLEQIDRTDFLLPRGGILEIEVPPIPPEIRPFRKIKSYRRYKRQADAGGFAEPDALEDDAV